MNKTGVMLGDLGASQLSFNVVNKLNEECEKSNDDFVVFVENISNHIIPPNFAIMGVNEIWSFDGILIATSASTSLHMAKSASPAKKFFYVWDLEWMRRNTTKARFGNLGYSPYAPYISPHLELICRSRHHADIIENNFNRKVKYIVDDFNIEQIMEITNNEQVNI